MTLEELITAVNSIPRHKFEHFDCDKVTEHRQLEERIVYRGSLRVAIANNKRSHPNHSGYFNSSGQNVSELIQNLYDEIPK